MMATVSYLVMRTKDADKLKIFYETIGLSFVKEQHGEGPWHYSCMLGNFVLEIYPATDAISKDMLGFKVDNLESRLQELQKIGAQVKTRLSQKTHKKKAVVYDYDGRIVELIEVRKYVV